MKLILEGITTKGKNRIREHGKEWLVESESNKVLFSDVIGSWLFIYPINDKEKKYMRWINKNKDIDFKIISMEER